MKEEIWEALEATTIGRKQTRMAFPAANANWADHRNWRDALMRFLEEIDGELSVSEVRDALEDYK